MTHRRIVTHRRIAHDPHVAEVEAKRQPFCQSIGYAFVALTPPADAVVEQNQPKARGVARRYAVAFDHDLAGG